MELMLDHLAFNIQNFATDPVKIFLVLLSIVVLFYSHRALSSARTVRLRIAYSFLHVLSIIFPLLLFGISLTCTELKMDCSIAITQALAFSIPVAILLTMVFSIFVVPLLFARKSRILEGKWVSYARAISLELGLPKPPMIYAFDSGVPQAFSHSFGTPAIFLSVGLLESMGNSEIEAVILHELGHISAKSSFSKLVFGILSRFSPLGIQPMFHALISDEESIADRFAIKIQETSRHLNSAKRKLDSF
ncbi:TPA: M48 family metalloprotease [Candidatus Micrarchaeota archaeon]|nr:M48 family metalloprotease [Candidatus Micrarchaeota archaeon]